MDDSEEPGLGSTIQSREQSDAVVAGDHGDATTEATTNQSAAAASKIFM